MTNIRELLRILGDIGRFDVTIGVSEALPVECLFVLKDKSLYDRIKNCTSYVDSVVQIPGRQLSSDELVAAILGKIGQKLNKQINLSYNELSDRDCLILFKSPDLVGSIYSEII